MTETALLRAIARNPDEDTPRLAYADWLDENDRPERAEFIRGQIEYATTPTDTPRRREVAFRCRQLLDQHQDDWREPVDALHSDRQWSRGFIELFTTSPRDLSLQDAALFDTHPFQRVWVTELDPRLEGLALLPTDNRIAVLDLSGNDLTTNSLKRLAKLSHLSHLRELVLLANHLRDTAVKVLMGEPLFQRLSLIRLAGNPFTRAARQQLRAHFGDRVSFAYERNAEQLFTVLDDYVRAGWAKGHAQFLMLAGSQRQQVAWFDHAGTLLMTEERVLEGAGLGSYAEQEVRRETARDAWLAELGYQSATIKVKAFRFPSGCGLTPFNWWLEYCDRASDPERPQHVERVQRWLENGKYRFDFVRDDAWFDGDGEVTDT